MGSKKKQPQQTWQDVQRDIVRAIRHRLVDLDLNETDLVRKSGVSKSIIDKTFNYRMPMKIEVMVKLFLCLDMRVPKFSLVPITPAKKDEYVPVA